MAWEQFDSALVKPSNNNRIYHCIYHKGKMSKQDIATHLGMSLPTVSQYLRQLMDIGLVREEGAFASTGGRKAKAIVCVRDARVSVGVYLSVGHISIVLVDLMGEILRKTRIKKTFQNTLAYFDQLSDLVAEFLHNCKVGCHRVLGVGIALPGIHSQDHSQLLYSHALQITRGLVAGFNRSFSYPVFFSNDANAAGWAEAWKLDPGQNAVYLSLSDTVGGAILLGNQLYYGTQQRGAELGHMTLVPDGRACYCGKAGCVDAYCCARLLSDAAGGNLDLFFQQLREGDYRMKAIWEDYLTSLAIVVNNLRMLFDAPVILGGDVGGYLEEFLPQLQRMVAQRNPFEDDQGEYLLLCSYKNEAAAVGAALHFVETFLKKI